MQGIQAHCGQGARGEGGEGVHPWMRKGWVKPHALAASSPHGCETGPEFQDVLGFQSVSSLLADASSQEARANIPPKPGVLLVQHNKSRPGCSMLAFCV